MLNLSQVTNLSQTAEVKNYGWIEFDIKQTPPTLNYVKSFLQQNDDSRINYKALDIPKADPFAAGSGSNFSFELSSMQNRLSKWGTLSFPKNSKEDHDYDLDDSFIDDDEKVNKQSGPNVGLYESAWDDFVCLKGGLEAFRNSEYYQERISSLRAGMKEETKPKKKRTVKKKDENPEAKPNAPESQGPKEPEKKPKKKRPESNDMINKRESEDVKKVKKSESSSTVILANQKSLTSETPTKDTETKEESEN